MNRAIDVCRLIYMKNIPALMLLFIFGIFLLFMAGNFTVKGQSVSISAKFDTTYILIGEQTGFNIILEQPEGTNVNFPRFSGKLSENIEILAENPSDTVLIENNTLRITKSYRVTSFDQGEQFVEPIGFTFLADGGQRTLSTPRTALVVGAPEVDEEAGVYDIKDPLAVPVGIMEILPWFIILMAVALITWYLYRYYKKRRRVKNGDGDGIITDPPHVIALRDLERLKSELLWEKGQVREYYTRLTEIVRIYIERQFGVPAMEKTSNEIIDSLAHQNNRGHEPVGLLRDCFYIADLVKFARAYPGEEEHKECYNHAFRFVEATTELPQDTGEETNPAIDGKEIARLTDMPESGERNNTNSISEK